jgi:hypothetical protein
LLAIGLVAVALSAEAKPGHGHHRGWNKHRQPVIVVQQPVRPVIVQTRPVVVVPVRQAPPKPSVELTVRL